MGKVVGAIEYELAVVAADLVPYAVLVIMLPNVINCGQTLRAVATKVMRQLMRIVCVVVHNLLAVLALNFNAR